MRIQTIPITSRATHKRVPLTYSFGLGVILVLITATAFYTVTSAASSKSRNLVPAGANKFTQRAELSGAWQDIGFNAAESFFVALLPQEDPPPSPEAIATFETTGGANPACTNNAKSNFVLGEAVCAKVVNAPTRAGAPVRRVNFTGTKGFVRSTHDVTSSSQEFIFTLPTSNSTVFENVAVDNRGRWSASMNATSNGSTRTIAYFNVSDPQAAAADLEIYAFSTSADPLPPGASTGFFIWLSNSGPDTAQNVKLTVPTPNSMSYTSTTQHTGPAFTCAQNGGVVECTISSLQIGQIATLTFNYTIGGGASNGVASTTTTIESDTADPRLGNNVSDASVEIRAAGAPPSTCSLGCPGNRIITADPQTGGANVTFNSGDIESSGECGTISLTPDSGFLAIGTHTIQVSAGGSSCSFTVEVVDPADFPAPTIDCEDDLSAQAPANENEASVTVTPPTGTGTNITITGVRNDNRAINDPYPVGTTTITWTARECLDAPGCEAPARTASCTQKVVVTAQGAPTIDCPDDKTFTAPGCEITLTAEQIDTPETTGTSTPITVTSRRSDDLPLLDPYPAGPTTITWTATDNIGRIVSCTQVINVIAGNDNVAPTLDVPPDVSATTSSCSAVLDDELGVATADDNCGSVTIARTGVPSVACPIPGDPNRRCETFVFPTGETIITYTAKDAAGNQTVKTQKVTVTESPADPPSITAPPDVTVNADNGACSATGVALGTPTASDNCAIKSVTNDAPASFPVGTTTVTWTVTDQSGNTDTDTQDVTVIDNQNPTITAPPDVEVNTDLDSCSATGVALGTPTTADNCQVASVTNDAPSVFPLGETTVTWTVTDTANRTATAIQKVIVSDKQKPTITVPANVTVSLPLNSPATSMVVTYPPATATDNCVGAITINYSHPSGSVFPVGPTTVTVTATDAHNNTQTATFTVTVLYNFTGFFSPVNNLPTLNSVNAGKAIPVKFSLSGNKGLDIFAPNNPYSVSFNCNTNDPGVDIVETVTAGGSSLSYSPDQYSYVWKTESSWAGTCRQLVIKLNDGTEHKANFKFK